MSVSGALGVEALGGDEVEEGSAGGEGGGDDDGGGGAAGGWREEGPVMGDGVHGGQSVTRVGEFHWESQEACQGGFAVRGSRFAVWGSRFAVWGSRVSGRRLD